MTERTFFGWSVFWMTGLNNPKSSESSILCCNIFRCILQRWDRSWVLSFSSYISFWVRYRAPQVRDVPQKKHGVHLYRSMGRSTAWYTSFAFPPFHQWSRCLPNLSVESKCFWFLPTSFSFFSAMLCHSMPHNPIRYGWRPFQWHGPYYIPGIAISTLSPLYLLKMATFPVVLFVIRRTWPSWYFFSGCHLSFPAVLRTPRSIKIHFLSILALVQSH